MEDPIKVELGRKQKVKGNFSHTQSVLRWLNSYNFSTGLRYNYTTVELLNNQVQGKFQFKNPRIVWDR